MSDPGTPRPGIRLAGGAPIPPAPSLGNHRPIRIATVALRGHWALDHSSAAA